jgi:hypothetical protein
LYLACRRRTRPHRTSAPYRLRQAAPWHQGCSRGMTTPVGSGARLNSDGEIVKRTPIPPETPEKGRSRG